MTRAGQLFDSYAGFYHEIYPDAIVDVHPAGRTGAVVMRAQQDSGDWSDAATPDLILLRPKTNGIGASLDIGAGLFRTICPPHSFVVVAADTASTIIVDAAHSLEIFAVPYDGLVSLAGEDANLPSDGDFGTLHTRMHTDREVGQLFDRLFSEVAIGSPRGALYADSVLLHLTARLMELRSDFQSVDRETVKGGLAPWQVKRVCEVMVAAMDQGEEEASLADLALMVGLSAHHFCRSFALSMGSPPHRWMTERRMERATKLLGDRTLGLTEIAVALGYTSQSAFGRAYARVTGVTPSARRRELLS